MTSGLSWHLEPVDQDTPAVAQLIFCSLLLLARTQAGGQRLQPGTSPRSPSQILPHAPPGDLSPRPFRAQPRLGGWPAGGRMPREMGHISPRG